MNKIKKEQVSHYEVFVAADGTEFNSCEECMKYEMSAYGVLNAKYQKLVVKSESEDVVFPGIGMDDHTCELVSIKSQAEADTVLQLYLLINSHLTREDASDWAKKWIERARNLVDLALKTGEYLLVGRNCDYDESMWFNGTPSSIKESIDSFLKVENNV
ncbi:hypothetical protein SAMN04488494_0576 [Xylanibacter ruminicola]|jgi:hypothetical protein|uniref:Uncharacterized protein n=1 Tax=Xylanibacter ruminicola TaxID=839 RepID=A0A1M7CZK5_XYLRU|nr:hypothetical protein [Xylanibacter ruminicola]SHL72585.1 hypothetical protein SAMN04488494_0576 [Xylanibacter ruminicola]